MTSACVTETAPTQLANRPHIAFWDLYAFVSNSTSRSSTQVACFSVHYCVCDTAYNKILVVIALGASQGQWRGPCSHWLCGIASIARELAQLCHKGNPCRASKRCCYTGVCRQDELFAKEAADSVSLDVIASVVLQGLFPSASC